MTLSRGTMLCGAGLAMLIVVGVEGQARPAAQAAAEKPQMAEEAFKNVRVLRGIPVREFMNTMGFFAASLSLNCTDCHGGASASDWANYATDTPLKNRARQMIAMVKAINEANFGGRPFVTCYTCHRGSQHPKVVPSLAAQYGEPPAEDPDEIEALPGARVTATADQVLDKYLQAVGGAQALGRLTSFTAKGTYEGFDSDFAKVPVDVYAKAPNLRAMVVHMASGDATSTYDGREAWLAYPRDLAPVPLIPLVGADITGARVDAQLAFPAPIKQLLTGWRADFPAVTIDDKPVQVVQGMIDRVPVKLYFDRASGLLVRQTRYAPTVVGTVPTHVTYSDYREVPGSGVKVPFTWQATWVDGQYTVNLTSVQPNAPIDAARFAKPAAPR
ncbi:MAG TPA: photosynthetic reaction center cytochrome c subunit family protein [Vicinamibacterales bacterium]|nr:photosynthetic reaction center cytochrome c subunit family protein [Vicinamibacterales bacterium]